jgi:hypothetical protein
MTVAGFFFAMKFREVIDIKFAICNRFDNSLVDLEPTGENINGVGITLIHVTVIRGPTPCFKVVKTIHELRKSVINRGTDGKSTVFH